MIKCRKNYFSFFGVLIATVNRKINSINNSILSIISQLLPKIMKTLHARQLKPIKLYSTNNI
ncbi:MAG: hypothetical protein ACNI25_06100 [Halarcobacter sp.]